MKYFYVYLWLFLGTELCAQSGAWLPGGADEARPRTLLKQSEISAVRASLSTPAFSGLYGEIYANALAVAPSESTDVAKLARSHIAKNAAFVLLMNKQYDSGSINDLDPSTATQLQAKVISLLENIAADVDRITIVNPAIYDSWQWRSKELIDYACAYDIMLGAGVDETMLATGKARIQTFAANLYTESTRMIAPPTYPVSFFDLVFNNHALMTASALGMAAVALNDATSTDAAAQPQSWINVAMWNIENVFFVADNRQSEPGVMAGYYEGPGYLRYSMRNCLPFFRAMGYFLPASAPLQYTWNYTPRTIANPYTDSRYEYIYDWVTKIRMPDGRIPSVEDTYMTDYFPELALTGKTKYNWVNAYTKLANSNSLSSQLTGSGVDLRANYIAASPAVGTFPDSALVALPASGNMVFRSGFDSSAIYMHVAGKNGNARVNSFGHNQADVSSFMICAKGEILALNPGYISYDRRSEVGNAGNHNMILVDGAGPLIGDPQYAHDTDGYIQKTFYTPMLSYGEVATAYGDAAITRRFLFVRNSYFINADFISAGAAHNFTWQLHGYGIENGSASDEGVFFDSLSREEGVWQKGSESLKMHTTVSGGMSSFQKVTSEHEFSYNVSKNHTAVYANKNGVTNAEFLTALCPYTVSSPQVTTLQASPLTALRVLQDTHTDVVFTQEGTGLVALDSMVSGFAHTLTSDGAVTFFSTANVSGDFDQAFLKNGFQLNYGTRDIIHATVRSDIALQLTGDLTWQGYVGSANTLRLNVNGNVQSVSGSGVQSWMQADSAHASITFSGPSNFTIVMDSFLPVELVSFSGSVAGSTVKLSWATASEVNNYGWEIERTTRENVAWESIGFVQGNGNSVAPKSYTWTDAKPVAGENLYRLKQKDVDGKISYGPMISVVVPVARTCSLEQNYPNPFNPTTVIAYTIPDAAKVTLSVFDITGRQVALVENGLKAAGRHEIVFGAGNLPSGCYFYTIRAGSFLATKKLMVVK